MSAHFQLNARALLIKRMQNAMPIHPTPSPSRSPSPSPENIIYQGAPNDKRAQSHDWYMFSVLELGIRLGIGATWMGVAFCIRLIRSACTFN